MNANSKGPKAIGNARWQSEIEFAIQAVKRRGFVANVVRALDDATGRQWFRQQVDRWLAEKPEDRIEPRAGIGFTLIDACKRVVDEMDEEEAKGTK